MWTVYSSDVSGLPFRMRTSMSSTSCSVFMYSIVSAAIFSNKVWRERSRFVGGPVMLPLMILNKPSISKMPSFTKSPESSTYSYMSSSSVTTPRVFNRMIASIFTTVLMCVCRCCAVVTCPSQVHAEQPKICELGARTLFLWVESFAHEVVVRRGPQRCQQSLGIPHRGAGVRGDEPAVEAEHAPPGSASDPRHGVAHCVG